MKSFTRSAAYRFRRGQITRAQLRAIIRWARQQEA